MAKLLHTNACLFKVYGKAAKCVADVKPRSTFLIWPVGLLIACSQGAMAQSQASVFTVSTNLQSIAVQVTDKKGNAVHGLTASDFTLLENGQPRKISFFEADDEPISLAILIDSGRTMDFGGKLDRARLFLTSLTGGERPEDEIFLMPFTDEIGPFQQLTSEQRSRPPMVATFGHSGSALYDALASALCHMRTVKNIRQAVVVITDGVDQNSRLRLDQLIGLVRSSSPQVFMVGLYSKPEYALFQQGHKTVPIVGQREIDNPVLVFKRLAKESGAESFFPSSEKDFKKALDHISALLKAEYTLAYYPPRVEEVRKIEVKVKRGGVKGSARHTVGSDNAVNTVHFIATACTVSPQQHPYPWESRVTSNSFSSMIYHEDFSDPRSGWPSHFNSGSGERYIRGGYELSRWVIPGNAHVQTSNGYIVDSGGTFVAAYGPWWNSFRAWSWVDTRSAGHNHAGMFFDVNESGYYALLLTPPVDGRVAFELVKGSWDGSQSVIVPRTSLAEFEQNTQHKLAVEVNRRQISLAVDNHHVGMIQNSTVEYGLVGFGLVGDSGGGRVIVSDLHVEAIP